MNIMILGSGGREHALAWNFSQSEKVNKIFCVPGNAGTAFENKCENLTLKDTELIDFAKKNVDITFVGPEQPLVDGIVDEFKKNKLKIFGPSKNGAKLEASKGFSKEFMKKYGVQTAKYEIFESYENALEYLKNSKFPIVIKADGLAAGKGVFIAETFKLGKDFLCEIMKKNKFGEAGKKVVIEEFLQGFEASIFALTDGENIKIITSAKDHKKILDGEKGLNTGGMGAICPHPQLTTEILQKFETKIMIPTLNGIKHEDMEYNGVLFFGIIVQSEEPYLLEYNVRFGDPETQAIMPLLETNMLEISEKTIENKIDKLKIKLKNNSSCCIVAVSNGYPETYEKGYKINLKNNIESKIFYAGTSFKDNELITSGGRVLSVVSTEETLEKAIKKAYNDIKEISFEGIYYRKDIGGIS
ncbi:phosphoribosylamine--glycine ligase [Tepiditoga spiralis]|uniref:Phosphoribosylamine--glycine ligase n=1 Tax=Tepiditoga spiralis TaxID=2108365 RepID=A0A7G1G4F0_9BACT|nr:phosphoribosylamine--glycine ligase [Tepiditoga spiralis]BBE31241.1 phosphoribosylamine--glycine ligase [Tepiditoga spiralis]